MLKIQNVNETTKLGKELFYIAYFIFLTRALLQNSTLAVYLNVNSSFYHYGLRFIACIFILIKICFCDRFSIKVFFAYAVLVAVTFVCIAINTYVLLFEIVALAMGAHGVSLKSVVKEFVYVASVICGLLFILSLCGIIENHIAYAGDIPRYSFGSVYPTDFAALLFYIQLAQAYLRKKEYTLKTFLFWVLIALFILKFCRARLNFSLILIFAAFMYLKKLFPQAKKNKFVQKLFVWAIPACLIFSIAIHLVYSADNNLLDCIDKLLSGRLYYGHKAIDDYGFTLFGKYIKMQGWGSSLVEWDSELGYYFVDSGWLNMTLRFGLITSVFICASFVIVSQNAFKNSDFVLPIILLFLSITSIIDHHVLEVGYNPFLIVIGIAINQSFISQKRTTDAKCLLKPQSGKNFI